MKSAQERHAGPRVLSPVSSVIEKIFVLTGSAGLIVMMLADTIAVAGRHIGMPFLGAIEIVQAAIVLMATGALVMATMNNEHATIKILTSRLSSPGQQLVARFSALVCFLFLALLAVAGFWIAVETIGESERSELLHIPYFWLRLIGFSGICVASGCFLKRVFKGRHHES